MHPDGRVDRRQPLAQRPLVVPAQRRRLAGDRAACVLAGRQVGEVAADQRPLDSPRLGDPRPRRPLGEAAEIGDVGGHRVLGQRGQRLRERFETPRRRSRRRVRAAASDTRSRVFADTSSLADSPGRTSAAHQPAIETRHHLLEPAARLADPARTLEPGERHRRLGDRHAEVGDDVVERARIDPAALQHPRLVAPRQRPRVVATAVAAVIETEGEQHVGGVGDRRRTVADQLVGPGSGAVVDRPGHGHHLDRPLQRLSGGRQRSTPLAALDHHEQLAEGGEDAVALREPEPLRFGARRPLGQQQPVARHGVPEIGVDPRVRRVETVGDDADDRVRSGAQRSTVGGAVDPLGQPGHDRHVVARKPEPERGGELAAGTSGVAGADDADAPTVQRRPVAAPEQHGGRLRIGAQHLGVGAVALGDGADAGASAPLGPLVDRPSLADRAHADGELAGEHRRHRRMRRRATGGDRERLLGLVVGEQHAAAAPPSSARSRPARRAIRFARRRPSGDPSRQASSRRRARATRSATAGRARRRRARSPRRRSSRSAIVRATLRMR